MTAPALFVLFLALVTPLLDTASMATDDFGKQKATIVRKNTQANRNHNKINHNDIIMNNIRTKANFMIHSNINVENITTRNNLENNEDVSKTINKMNTAIQNKELQINNLEIHRYNLAYLLKRREYIDESMLLSKRQYDTNRYKSKDTSDGRRRWKRQDLGDRCDTFQFNTITNKIEHPHDRTKKESYYYNKTDCVTIINATEGQIVELTFVDVYHIEEHPDCAYDYLEIRDGSRGYAPLIAKLCGNTFPAQFRSSGPNMWLKFHSDDTIEYEGFHINVELISVPNSRKIPAECYDTLTGSHGTISHTSVKPECISGSASQPLDVLWRIQTDPDTKIYLNFTNYKLKKPNNCEENFIQVFGSVLEETSELNRFCGSVANLVSTKGEENGQEGNVMHVRMFAALTARDLEFEAKYTAFRTLDPNKQQTCDETEFDCEDNTCIDLGLTCNQYANCRLKTDEDATLCAHAAESMINETHIMVILIIFSLILSGMSFVFLFKCIKKLYEDHKIIKEQIRQSCEDRLDNIASSRLTLDAKRLRQDSEPRASLERENHTNEMFKRQRSYPHQPTSIESDFIQETQLDIDDEPWRRDVDSVPVEREEVRIERNGRTRRSDLSKKEQSLRRDSEREETREKKEIRDVSVGAPDTKESGCQTRESLFEAGTGSEESSSVSRGFSTFGHTGVSLARPPPPSATSHLTIHLVNPQPTNTTQSKKLPDRRPMSNETTRSAPDVIIVSKPIR